MKINRKVAMAQSLHVYVLCNFVSVIDKIVAADRNRRKLDAKELPGGRNSYSNSYSN